MKKITGKLSLQWRLTLITALLMTVTCILMYFFISQSAVAGMENLGDYMIRIDNTDSAPITFNMDPSVLFPELSDQLQLTKKLFLTKGLMVTGIIILLSSICTYQPSGITSASQTQPGGKPNRGPEPFRGS